jgi:carbonic anhydrase/acetyltransferase-like protein (isoleucine patch superfamily)
MIHFETPVFLKARLRLPRPLAGDGWGEGCQRGETNIGFDSSCQSFNFDRIVDFRPVVKYRDRTVNGGRFRMIIEYKGKSPKISPTAFIAPTAVIIGDVTIGDEASIWWGAVLRSDQNQNPIVVGARTSIQDNCVLHSGEAPTIIEDDCTIGHGAIMEGPLIKRGAIIGMNVTLLENVEIGEEALIAAGSVVVPHTKIPPRVLAAGAPAKVKKELAGEALHWIKMGSSTYVNLCKSYLGGDFKVIG